MTAAYWKVAVTVTLFSRITVQVVPMAVLQPLFQVTEVEGAVGEPVKVTLVPA